MSTTKAQIEEFLKLKRIAVVGVSKDKMHFSRMVLKEYAAQGYDVVPVGRSGGEVDGRQCFASIAEVEPKVEGAIVMVGAAQSAAVAEECRRAGIEKLWIYKGENADGVSDECPLMWLKGAGWIHGAHKTVRGWFGGLPK
jgi:hypothetical protein